MFTDRRLLLALMVSIGLTACRVRPEPPTVVPQSAQIMSVTPMGFGVRVTGLAHNPNRYDLHVTLMRVRFSVANQPLGESQLPLALSLTANADTPMAADLTVPWINLPGVLLTTSAMSSIPYHVEGTVVATAYGFNTEVPFVLDGVVAREMLLNGAMNSVIPMIPQLLNRIPTFQ